ncbi:TPA: tail fiber protein [Pasteurella multocida]|nr:tail fiber protein [Pasteurella multocida]HDR1812217.1 tail fiber protein [Pasteurella multocida]
MPEVKAKKFNHNEPRWFTEGGNGIAPSYPGADWFNIVQAELLGVLTAGGINPDKTNLNQLTQAIQQVVQNKVTQALSGKANSNSPLLTGIPTAPTAPQSTNNTQIATTAFVKAAIAALVGSAPSSLDTLNELAAALNNNANFAASIINQLAGKADKTILDVFVGVPIPWPLASVPSGCLAFKGQSFNQSQYPILAQRYPNRILPDLRSEFIRGWDNGRNVDSNRQILSAQGDAIRNITGRIARIANDDQNQTSGAFTVSSVNSGILNAAYTGSIPARVVDFNASRVVATASENRPRNIAFQYICIAR